MSTETTSFAQAMATLQTRLPRIERDKTADVKTDKAHYRYTYADLAQVTAKLLPVMGELGLSFIARPTLNEAGKLVLAYKLLHVSGEFESGEYPLPTSGGPQQIGGAITYARRYCLCSVTGIAPEDDDDGAAAQAEQASQPRSAQRAAATQTRAANGRARQQGSTAQREQPALPGETNGTGITPAQQRKLHAVLRELDLADREKGLAAISTVLHREIQSTKDLSVDDAAAVIDALEAMDERGDPQGPTAEDIAAMNAEARL